MSIRRRATVIVALLAAGCASLSASEAASARVPVEIARGVWLLRGEFVPGRQPDGNSVVFDGAEGLVVVDTGRHAAHTRALIEFAEKRERRIAAVINTHWHLDHIGGNVLLRKRVPDVAVFATDAFAGARSGFLAKYREQLVAILPETADAAQQEQYRNELALLDGGDALAPTEIVTRSGARDIAGRRLFAGVGRGVTAGDLWLLDPATGVLVAGDLVTLPAPLMDTACPAQWLKALDVIAGHDFRLLVPGHGAPMTRESFDRYRNALQALVACGASDATKDACTNGWLANLGDLLPEADRPFARTLLDYYVDQHLRGDATRAAALCE